MFTDYFPSGLVQLIERATSISPMVVINTTNDAAILDRFGQLYYVKTQSPLTTTKLEVTGVKQIGIIDDKFIVMLKVDGTQHCCDPLTHITRLLDDDTNVREISVSGFSVASLHIDGTVKRRSFANLTNVVLDQAKDIVQVRNLYTLSSTGKVYYRGDPLCDGDAVALFQDGTWSEITGESRGHYSINSKQNLVQSIGKSYLYKNGRLYLDGILMSKDVFYFDTSSHLGIMLHNDGKVSMHRRGEASVTLDNIRI